MTTLCDQIDAVQAAVDRLRRGDVYALNEFPSLLAGLRQGVADLERRQEELASLYEVGQELVSILDLNHLLELILDRAIVLVGAERGFLVLWNPEQQDYEVAVARQFARGEVDDAQIEISHGVIRRVLASREPVVTSDAQEDPRFFQQQQHHHFPDPIGIGRAADRQRRVDRRHLRRYTPGLQTVWRERPGPAVGHGQPGGGRPAPHAPVRAPPGAKPRALRGDA